MKSIFRVERGMSKNGIRVCRRLFQPELGRFVCRIRFCSGDINAYGDELGLLGISNKSSGR